MFGKFKTTRSLVYFWVVLYGVLLFVNYLYREVFHSVPIDKIILGSDMEGYYHYLTHFFLKDWESFNRLPWALPYGEDKTLSVFTCGVAILWSPFFLLAHFISVFFQLDSDGYSNVYYGFILISAVFYVTIGLNYLYKTLREYFSHKTSLRTVLIFPFLTNLFYYTLFSPGMAHAYTFSLISIYIYYAQQFFRNNSFRNALFMGVPFALSVLIRPTNLIAGLYILFFDVTGVKSLAARLKFWLKNYHRVILLAVVGVLIFLPQMLYWYTVTGKPIFYSYQGYGFPNLLSPEFSTVLYGIRNGWLIYTPVVNFALAGLLILLVKKQYNSIAIVLVLFLSIYINASWWAPTFSAAVGQRAMIDFLPFLAFAFAYMIEKYDGLPSLLKTIIILVLLAFIFFNIQFSFKYEAYEWWDKPFSWGKLLKTLKF